MASAAGELVTVSPADPAAVVARRTLASQEQVTRVLADAKTAFASWRQVPLQERIAVVLRAIDAFVAKKDAIAHEIAVQMGRPIRYCAGEVSGYADRGRFMASIAEKSLEDLVPDAKDNFKRYLRREPLGVCLIIAPWNYPYLTAVNGVIPALLAGNTVVLKHSPQTPFCPERIFDSFKEAGLPEHVFQFVHMDIETTDFAIKNKNVDFVNFTGSVAGGVAVQKSASERFIPIGLELGGCDAVYVRADCNLAHAIENVVDAALFNSGQSCCGIQRVYVDEKIYDEFVKGVVDLTNTYVLGDPLDPSTTLGPVVRVSSADYIRERIKEDVAAGAVALIDSTKFPKDQPNTAFVAPQILVNVTHAHKIMSEEIFGPVFGIMKVTSEDEAVRLINDSQFGLTAAIWTSDLAAAERIGNQLEVGTVFMNRADYLDPALGWVGVKNSGRGCTLSSIGFDHLTRPKSYHLRLQV